MVIETRYDYIYYTVLDVEAAANVLQEADTVEELSAATSARERENIWIKSLNKLFRESNDFTVNNFRVDSAQYCDDIKHWCHRNIQHKECPVFIRYNEEQSVKIEGEGHMFYLYEEVQEEDIGWIIAPDCNYDGGLGGYGGRL